MADIRWRRAEQKLVIGVCVAAAIIASLMLFWIIFNVFLYAIPSLSLYFVLTAESDTPSIGMGIANAIVGSVIISLVATILATPIGVATAIYLQRYAKEGRAVRVFRYLIEVLSGTPSVVLGIFGLLVIAIYLGPITGGFSLISGSIALTILIIPVIERASEDAIQGTDRFLEEGSYALGATKWETLRLITLPAALSGILTGVILGFGRAAEESAVVILTAGYSQFMPKLAIQSSQKLVGGLKLYPFQDVIGTLPYSVYHAYENSNVIPMSNGFAAAFILIIIVLLINLSARTLFWLGTSSVKKKSPLLLSLKKAIFKENDRLSDNPPPKFPCALKENQEELKPEQIHTPSLNRVSSDPSWRRALTQPILPASSPVSSGISGEKSHPFLQTTTATGMPTDVQLKQDATWEGVPGAGPVPGPGPVSPDAGVDEVAVSDLFEEEPSGQSRIPEIDDPGFSPSSLMGREELLDEDFLTEDLHRDNLLMEEPRLPLPPVLFTENWRSMTVNKQENSHV